MRVHLEPPSDFDPSVHVAAIFLQHGERFLFLLRNVEKEEGNKWGMPAGKRDEGESVEATVVRELMEETGVQISQNDLGRYMRGYTRFPEHDFVFDMYHAELSQEPEVQIAHEEHQDYRWMTIEEALASNLVMGNDECIRKFFGLEE